MADAGYGGGVDGGGVVKLVLGEGEGEVLDAVGRFLLCKRLLADYFHKQIVDFEIVVAFIDN